LHGPTRGRWPVCESDTTYGGGTRVRLALPSCGAHSSGKGTPATNGDP
jgi:hypothetical protein